MIPETVDAVVWGEPSLDTVVVPLGYEKLDSRNPADVIDDVGGSGANTASSLSLLGATTVLVGSLGSDSVGERIAEELASRNMRLSMGRVPRSRRTVSIARSDGTRTMYGTTGDQYSESVEVGREVWAMRAKIFHLSLTSILRSEHDHISAVIGHFRSTGAMISMDAGNDVEILSSSADLRRIFADIQPDLLFANSDEIRALGSMSVVTGSIPLVVVKNGSEPAQIWQNGILTASVPVPHRLHPVDTTGAGDAFAAGMLAGLLRGRDAVGSATIGHLVAGACIASAGASIRDSAAVYPALTLLSALGGPGPAL